MKKKNFLWSMLTIMMVTMLSVGFWACSSDDDKDDNAVVGTWISVDVDVDGSQRHTYTITFKSNGTGTSSKKHEHQGEEPYVESGSFTYTPISNTTGTIAEEDYDSYGPTTYYYRYVVTGNKLRIYDEDDDDYYDEYTKQ